jgi:hypothetical protein
MKRLLGGLAIAACVSLLGACAGTAPPIPVGGSPADIAALAGQWTGDYDSPAAGRSGSIVFTLSAGADTANGDVVMLPRVWNSPAAGVKPGGPQTPPVTAQALSISFVRASDGHVTGRLDPYHDPDCDCMVVTTFDGRLKGDTIEGTFVTTNNEKAAPRRGTWKVSRKK